MGSVESVKAASDIYTPVSGQIEQVNEALIEQASLLNKDPMGKGELTIATLALSWNISSAPSIPSVPSAAYLLCLVSPG